MTLVCNQIFAYEILTDYRWITSEKVVTIGKDAHGHIYKIAIARKTGLIEKTPITMDGTVLSLSTMGDNLLVARPVDEKKNSIKRSEKPIIEMRPVTSGFNKREEPDKVPVAIERLNLFIIHSVTGSEKFLMEIPADIAIKSVAWSFNDKCLAIVRSKIINFEKIGNLEVKNALGNISPEENPFFTTNALEIFSFETDEIDRKTIRPDLDDREIFSGVVFSPKGRILMAETWEATIIAGRTYPLFGYALGSNYKFYDGDGDQFRILSRPEVDITWSYQFLSPLKVLFTVPYELTFRMYCYDVITGELTALSTPEGYISSVQPFHLRNTLVFEFDSFLQPSELFTMDLDSSIITPITQINQAAKEANKIRADKVQFTLSNGAKRIGYLIQPKTAAFPPKNVSLCVWQEGGPIIPMINAWYTYVEGGHNLLPNFGIATLMVPLPGRSGFGKAFITSLFDDYNFGQIDIDEQMEISQQLINRGYTEPDRIGIYGMSYGGYFTSQTITTYPNFYAAANNQFSLIN